MTHPRHWRLINMPSNTETGRATEQPMDERVPYTPGPIKWVEDRFHGGYSGLFTLDDFPVLYPQRENDGDEGAAWFNTDGDAGDETLIDGDARLLAAAFNSYARHFGPDAVKAAEDDLLGQALEALRDLLDVQNGPPLIRHEAEWNDAVDQANAILARVQEHDHADK